MRVWMGAMCMSRPTMPSTPLEFGTYKVSGRHLDRHPQDKRQLQLEQPRTGRKPAAASVNHAFTNCTVYAEVMVN